MGVACGTFLASGLALAQTPADEFIRDQAARARTKRLEAVREATPAAAPENGKAGQAPSIEADGSCFPVQHIMVEGVTRFSGGRIARLVAPYENSCIGLAGINALLRAVSHLYLDEGLVTSRVYVPKQDIGETKILRLVVVEGKLFDIYLNGKPAPSSGVLGTAFPGLRGSIVNIRDIEQGLDQINRLASNKASTKMLPGPDEGTSILNIENTPGKPWHFSFANSNLGPKQTGIAKSSVSLNLDNLARLNDSVLLSYERTGPDYPGTERNGVGHSNSYSSSVSVPYGSWTFSVNGSWYDYTRWVPGNFGAIKTSGDSRQIGVKADRVILRDRDSITTINAGLTYKETNNFLLGSRIEVGSRRYTMGNLGFSHSRRMLGGVWTFDLGYEQGLNLFGAVKKGEPGAGGAEPRFSKFTATLAATKLLEIKGQRFEFSSILSGQYSPDPLFGAEQITLGNHSNVRGTRDSVLFGNNGFFTRKQIAWRTMPWANNAQAARWLGELRPYAGLDYGRVFGQERFGIEGGNIAGWTLGAKLVGGVLNLDAGYSRIFHGRPKSGDDLFHTSISLRW